MADESDELHLRLIYRRIAELRSAAISLVQLQQANAVRNRVTAELVRHGWRIPEIAAALGKTYRQVRHWYEQGRMLEVGGLLLPSPSVDPHSGRVTVPEVARRLKVNEATVRRWIGAGYLLATRASNASHGRWVVDAAALERLGIPEATMTVQEMARQHGVQPMTVRGWISRGDLATVAVMPGGVLRIPVCARASGRRGSATKPAGTSSRSRSKSRPSGPGSS